MLASLGLGLVIQGDGPGGVLGHALYELGGALALGVGLGRRQGQKGPDNGDLRRRAACL